MITVKFKALELTKSTLKTWSRLLSSRASFEERFKSKKIVDTFRFTLDSRETSFCVEMTHSSRREGEREIESRR